jgi:hypothetical protein
VIAEVIIPWRGGCPWRERALEFVRSRYDWPVIIAPAPDGAWCKAAAVTPAVEASCADVLVIADADVFTDGLDAAVEAVADGAPWAVPHHLVHRLDPAGTDAVLAGADWRGQPLAQRPYAGFEGGGIVVIRRDVALDVPMPTFYGWSGEDEAWAYCLRTLAGPPWRGNADLVHCWHPPQERMSRRWGSPENRELAGRYRAARGDREAMRALLEEVKPCRPPA